jgi:hypothetical protein
MYDIVIVWMMPPEELIKEAPMTGVRVLDLSIPNDLSVEANDP